MMRHQGLALTCRLINETIVSVVFDQSKENHKASCFFDVSSGSELVFVSYDEPLLSRLVQRADL